MNNIKGKLSKIKEESDKLRKEVKERTIGYIVAALGLVAGLAWNEAIKAVIEHFFPFNGNSVWAKLIYAIIITLVIILVSYYLIKFITKKED